MKTTETNHEKLREKHCLAYCVSQRSRRKQGGGRGSEKVGGNEPQAPHFFLPFYLPTSSPFTPARQATIVWAATKQLKRSKQELKSMRGNGT